MNKKYLDITANYPEKKFNVYFVRVAQSAVKKIFKEITLLGYLGLYNYMCLKKRRL